MPRSAEPIARASRSPPTVAVVSDTVDGHGRALIKAFAAHGVRAQVVRLLDCHIDTSQPFGLRLPGFEARLPGAVFVRTMAGGSFEAVTLRLGVLHALTELGVTVWNTARAIERCVDKSATSLLLARAGIATPTTWAAESRAAAAAILRRAGSPLVLKPLFGSQGRGLRLIYAPDDLPPSAAVAGVYYLQRFVGAERQGFHDFRLLVSRGRVIAAMMRHSAHWITNVKQGAKPIAAMPDSVMRDMALAATAAVGADFAGVDIILDGDEKPLVLEVNSMPAWSGLQGTTSLDIAAELAGDLLAAMATGTVQGAVR